MSVSDSPDADQPYIQLPGEVMDALQQALQEIEDQGEEGK